MILIIVLFSAIIIHKINKALLRLEFTQEALCYDIYVLNNETIKEERALLSDGKINL